MKKSNEALLIFGAILCAMTVLSSSEAKAIPAFARAYGVPCSTCHTAITRRNEFGDAFRKAGYHWPGGPGADRRARKAPPIELGGIAALTSDLPAWLPVGLSGTLSGAYSNDTALANPIVLGSPSFNILFGSALGDHASFFGTWAGRGAPDELYLHFARIGGLPELNIRAGLFEQTTTIVKNNETLIDHFVLGTSNLNGHTVAQSRLGLEINGALLDRTFYAVGVVQNGGIGTNADLYYRVSHKFGGITLSGEEPDIDLEEPSFWEDFIVTLGHWAYFGKVSDATTNVDTALIRRFGGDAKIRFHAFSLWGGIMLGLDRDLAANAASTNLTWFVEISYSILSWLTPIYLYQYQDSRGFEREAQKHDFGLIILVAENIRGRAKFSFTDDGVRNEFGELQFLFGF